MGSYKLINHTADIGISVEGEDLKDLFATAARAMFSQIIDPNKIKARETKKIELEGENTEDLLVRWLNELLFISESGYFPKNINIEKIDEKSVLAVLEGERIDLRKVSLKQEVKAATYHQLEIKKNASGSLQTTIVFDV